MSTPIVVIGGGLAAGKTVGHLRELGYDGDVVLFAEEPVLPYERPPLSKAYLQGEAPADAAYVHPEEWYAANGVDLRIGTRVERLDLTEQTVHAAGEQMPFAKVVLATGARSRRLPLTQTPEIAVAYLRTMRESTALRERLGDGHHLLVLGAGWIGMEVAATARLLGTTVTVVEPAEQPLLAALGPDIGARFAALHREHGVDLRTGTALDRLDAGEALLTDGSVVTPDTVLVGIGAVPNDELARWAGLDVDNGVLVDAELRTSHPDVFAIGDVANVERPLLGQRLRVEHWQSAIDHGKAVAHALVGEPAPEQPLPYFFTDQYDWGMEYFGHADRDADVRVEEGAEGGFAAWWTSADRLVAAMHVGQWDRSDELRSRVHEGWSGSR